MGVISKSCMIGVAVFFLGAAASAQAQGNQDNGKWWPVKVIDSSSGQNNIVEYTPLKKASKPWKICVLFPHMKDSFWVAVDKGIADEAKRQNVNMQLFEAGGYENLPRQLSQFDDCMAANYDAIVVGAISEAGLAKKFKEAIDKGIPVISTVNPVKNAPTTAKMFVDFTKMGEKTGKYLVNQMKGEKANVVTFPGPAGSGWAEEFNTGFKNAVSSAPNVKVLDTKFGDTGVAVQLQLIQDALQAYPSMNVIWGSAPTAEAAIAAVAQSGRNDIKILSAYENQAMLDAMKRGDIMGFATQYPVLEGKVAIDQAVRALEKKDLEKYKYVQPIPDMISKANVDKINMSLVLAPQGWTPVYQVNAK